MKELTFQEFLYYAKGWPARDFPPHELFRSDVALKKRLENLPTNTQLLNVRRFAAQVLDPLRAVWGGPLIVTSCFRLESVNLAVGGARNSYHLADRGAAADLTTVEGTIEDVKTLYLLAARTRAIPFAELVLYNDPPYRIHVGWDMTPEKNIRELLIKVPGGYEPFVLPPEGGPHV